MLVLRLVTSTAHIPTPRHNGLKEPKDNNGYKMSTNQLILTGVGVEGLKQAQSMCREYFRTGQRVIKQTSHFVRLVKNRSYSMCMRIWSIVPMRVWRRWVVSLIDWTLRHNDLGPCAPFIYAFAVRRSCGQPPQYDHSTRAVDLRCSKLARDWSAKNGTAVPWQSSVTCGHESI